MRRLLILLFAVLILIFTFPAFAQEQTPEPLDQEEIIALATQAAETIEQAIEMVDKSNDNVTKGLDILNLFGVIFTILGVAAAILGSLGVWRLFTSGKMVDETRKALDQTQTAFQAEMNTALEEVETTLNGVRTQAQDANRAISLLPIGQQQYLVQDYNGAMDTYKRALKLDENNAVIHYRLGYVNVLMDELEQAQEYLDRALEIDPEFLAAQAALGYVYRRMAELLPDSAEKTKLINDAENKLLGALEKSPKLVDADGESWWGALGSLRRRFRDRETAIDAYERAAEVTLHSSYPLGNLALLYGEKGDYDRMVEIYKEVEILSRSKTLVEPNNYWWYTDLLVAELVQGKFDAAKQTLQNVVENMTDAKSPLESLLRALKRLGKMVMEEDKNLQIQKAVKRLQERIDEMDKSDPVT